MAIRREKPRHAALCYGMHSIGALNLHNKIQDGFRELANRTLVAQTDFQRASRVSARDQAPCTKKRLLRFNRGGIGSHIPNR